MLGPLHILFPSCFIHSFPLLTVIAHIYWHAPLVIGFKSRKPFMIRWSESSLCICTQDFKEVRKSSVDREVFIFWLPDLSLVYWITRIYFYFFGISTLKKKIVHHEFRANSTIPYKNYPVIRLLEIWYIA